jgi:flagellar protein FlaG
MEVGSLQAGAMLASTVQPAPASSEITADQRQIVQAVKALNATEMFGEDSELTFVLDRETHRPLVRIIDKKTNEVIRQIPPEYALRMAEYLEIETS